MPESGAAYRVVFLRVPEGTIIHRVDGHRAVIAPAVDAGLRAATGDELSLALWHRARWIADQSSCVANRWVEAAARHAEPQPHVADVILRDAGHPAMVAVARRIHPLLGQIPRPRAALAQLEPVNAGPAPASDGVVGDQGLMTAEIAVGQMVHQAVGNDVQRLGGTRLRYVEGARVHVRGGDDQIGVSVDPKGGTERVGPVHAKLPHPHGIVRAKAKQGTIVPLGKIVGCPGQGLQATIQVSRQHTAIVDVHPSEVKGHHPRRQPQQHLVPLKGRHTRAAPRPVAIWTGSVELVDRHIIAIGPHAELGIVVHHRIAKLVHPFVGITIPGPSRIGRLGDRDTGQEGTVGIVGQGKLAHKPALGQRVEQDDGIPIVGVLAVAAKALPGGVAVGKTRARRVDLGRADRVGHIPDRVPQVDPLEIVAGAGGRVVADIALRIGGSDGRLIVHPLKADDGYRQSVGGQPIL